jgi:hypothetical protein
MCSCACHDIYLATHGHCPACGQDEYGEPPWTEPDRAASRGAKVRCDNRAYGKPLLRCGRGAVSSRK